jgi:tRNA threonylcarbamoyladenosine biosynthesis protein TsaE
MREVLSNAMPILNPHALEFFSRSPEQTRRLGIRLGSLIRPGDLICLSGDLGAGKTTLVQGMAQGWGSLDAVSSPTFVICNEYRRPDDHKVLYHLDAYRLSGPDEAIDLDLDRMLESGAMVVEWAERIQSVLPSARLWMKLRYVADEQRAMVLLPEGSHYEQIVSEFRRQSFGG